MLGDRIITANGQLITSHGEVFDAKPGQQWNWLDRVGSGFITHLDEKANVLWYVKPKGDADSGKLNMLQARLNDEQQRWNYYRDAAQNRLGAYAGLLGMSPGANATNQTSQSSGSMNPPTNWGGIASGALYAAAPYLNNLFGGSSSSGGWPDVPDPYGGW